MPVCLPAPAFLLASRLCLLLWLAIVEHIWNMCNCFARIQPTSHSLTRQNPDNITVRVHAYLFFYVCFETQQTTANDLTLHLCRRYKAYTKTFEMGNRVDGLTSWLTGRQAGKHTLTNISQNKQIISHLSCRNKCAISLYKFFCHSINLCPTRIRVKKGASERVCGCARERGMGEIQTGIGTKEAHRIYYKVRMKTK